MSDHPPAIGHLSMTFSLINDASTACIKLISVLAVTPVLVDKVVVRHNVGAEIAALLLLFVFCKHWQPDLSSHVQHIQADAFHV